MDYSTLLREATESPHAIFHIFMLTISKARPNEQYFFLKVTMTHCSTLIKPRFF